MSLDELLRHNTLCLSSQQVDMLHEYCRILLEWNKTHSLSGFTNIEQLYEALLDSLYPMTFLEDFESVIDIGSGAGLPAVPLSIAYPAQQFTLLEPLAKKYAFLEYARISLGLQNVRILKRRAEECTDIEADIVTSRAVAETKTLISLSSHLLKKGGSWLLYKGERALLETEGIDAQIHRWQKRQYVVVRKKTDGRIAF